MFPSSSPNMALAGLLSTSLYTVNLERRIKITYKVTSPNLNSQLLGIHKHLNYARFALYAYQNFYSSEFVKKINHQLKHLWIQKQVSSFLSLNTILITVAASVSTCCIIDLQHEK